MLYFAGIDIGTTNIKGSLYSSEGVLVSSSSVSYPSYSPKEDCHEQNPDDWVRGFVDVLGKLLKNDKVSKEVSKDIKKNLTAISISTQGGTLVPVDKDFNPLYKAITWLDRRGQELFLSNRKLRSKNTWFYKKTGWRLDSGISFMALWWMKEKHPELFNKIYKILYVNDYVQKKITGGLVGSCYQDPSNASITLFYNVKVGDWDNEIMSLLGLTKDNFSDVKNPGYFVDYLDEEICKSVGIKNKVIVVNGSHDQYCVGLGTGMLDKNELLLATGTAWVIFKMLDRPLLDCRRFFSTGRFSVRDRVLVSKSVNCIDDAGSADICSQNNKSENNEFKELTDMDDKFGLIYAIPTGGASLRWFATNVLNFDSESKFFELVDKADNLEKLRLIKNNVIFYPYLAGAFGPDFDIKRKASFLNLELCHNHLDLIKAIMEGVGFQLKKILLVLKEKGINPVRIKMVGGGAKSAIWPQIIADISDLEVLIPENPSEDFATKGASILAGYGAGIFHSLEEGYNKLKSEFRVVKPGAENVKFYQDKFKLF